MGQLQKDSPRLRIWAGEKAEEEYDNVGVLIYRDRLPQGVSFQDVRRKLISEIEDIVRRTPYSYWLSPKATSFK